MAASQTINPARAGGSHAHPALSRSITPHATFASAMAFMTTRPHATDRFQNARHSKPRMGGTNRVVAIFASVHSAVSHSLPGRQGRGLARGVERIEPGQRGFARLDLG